MSERPSSGGTIPFGGVRAEDRGDKSLGVDVREPVPGDA
jgi:hypothetical protein